MLHQCNSLREQCIFIKTSEAVNWNSYLFEDSWMQVHSKFKKYASFYMNLLKAVMILDHHHKRKMQGSQWTNAHSWFPLENLLWGSLPEGCCNLMSQHGSTSVASKTWLNVIQNVINYFSICTCEKGNCAEIIRTKHFHNAFFKSLHP